MVARVVCLEDAECVDLACMGGEIHTFAGVERANAPKAVMQIRVQPATFVHAWRPPSGNVTGGAPVPVPVGSGSDLTSMTLTFWSLIRYESMLEKGKEKENRGLGWTDMFFGERFF